MLDKKDKILFEYLMQDCRISISKLSKITRLTKPTVLYRINRLEENNFIVKYDAILNYNILPYKPNFYFISVKSDLELEFLDEIKKLEDVETLNKLYHYKNYFVSAIFKTKLQKKKFFRTLKKYDVNIIEYEFEKIEFIDYKIYDDIFVDINTIKIIDDKIKFKHIKLDDIDLLLLEKLSNGYAKYSILNLSLLLDVNYHTLLYKFKRLVKNGYFLKFVAQPNSDLTQNDIILLKFKDVNMKDIVNKLNQIKTIPYLIKLNYNNYFIQILSVSFEDYKKTLGKIVALFEKELINFEAFNLDKTIILNQYPFDYLRKSKKIYK